MYNLNQQCALCESPFQMQLYIIVIYMEVCLNLQSCLPCTLYCYLLVLSGCCLARGLFLHLYCFFFLSIFPLLLSNSNSSCLRPLFNSKTTTKNVLWQLMSVLHIILYSFCVSINSGSELFEFGLLHVKSI